MGREWHQLVSSKAPVALQALEARLVERLCDEFSLTASVPKSGSTPNVHLHPPARLGARRIGILRVTNGHFYVDGDRSKLETRAARLAGVTVAEGKYLTLYLRTDHDVESATALMALAVADRTP